MSKISIIVPIYKTEQYLGRCVDSILAQTFTDFELILVDDGSPDNCPAICDEYAERDVRVVVIHQQNQGAAASRNVGLDVATGDYLIFCDSDDMVSPRWLEHLIGYAEPTVLPVCSYCGTMDKLGKPVDLDSELGQIVGLHYSIDHYWLFNKLGVAGYLWNALYCNSIIREQRLRLRIQPQKGDYNEDLLFAISYVKRIEKIVYIGYSDYLYDMREGSLSHAFPKCYFEKYEEKYYLWKDFLQGQLRPQKELAALMLYHFLTALNNCDFLDFRKIVRSTAMQECVALGNPENENPSVLSMISKKHTVRLWIKHKLYWLKGKIK